jgi:hypothetical protein
MDNFNNNTSKVLMRKIREICDNYYKTEYELRCNLYTFKTDLRHQFEYFEKVERLLYTYQKSFEATKEAERLKLECLKMIESESSDSDSGYQVP